MASWEPELRAAVTRAAGREIIESIDHNRKMIVIKSDVTDPSSLRDLERLVGQVATGYRVVQLT